MKYVPRLPPDHVNVTQRHPLKELAELLAATVLILVAVYLVLGWLVDFAADRISPELEAALGSEIDLFGASVGDERQELAERLFNALLEFHPADGRDYNVIVVESDDVNALALPGGRVVIFAGLIDQAETENELSMVLGHELGHFQNRDHLRGLGRRLVLASLVGLIGGNNRVLSGLMNVPAEGLATRYGRGQELAADQYGLDLLVKRYGHAAGATDFFARSGDESSLGFSFFATHPSGPDRVDALRELIAKSGAADGDPIPIAR